jgi:hypothetical protein
VAYRLDLERCLRRLPDDWVRRELKGKVVGSSAYDLVLGDENVDVYWRGALLLALRHKAVPADVCRLAWEPLIRAAKLTDNRWTAAGGGPARQEGKRRRAYDLPSGMAGAAPGPCRRTARTARDWANEAAIQPLLRACDEVYRLACPDHYRAQRAVAERTHPYWLFPGTVFTTVTPNRTTPFAVHKDPGDLGAGLAVMPCLRAGEYSGGILVLAAYRLGIDLGHRDVVLAPFHREWHAVTRPVGVPGRFERVTCVCYYLTEMQHCGTPAEEAARRAAAWRR